MRTFEQYIRESVDFRLGGSSNKGAAAQKPFEDLEEGERVYRTQIYFDMPGEVIQSDITQSTWELFKKEKERGELNFTFLFVNPESDKLDIHRRNNYTLSELQDWAYDDYIVARKMARIKKVIIYSTIEISKEEAIQIAKDVYNKTNEAVDFRLGGSANKGAVPHTFKDLKKGDIFYKYIISDGKIEKENVCEFDHISDGADSVYIKYSLDGTTYQPSIGNHKDIKKTLNSSIIIKRLSSYYFMSTYELNQEKIDELIEKFENDNFEKSRTGFGFIISYVN